MNLAILNLSAGQLAEADKNASEAIKGFEKLYVNEPDRILPSLLSAKYIKGLVLMHQGDLEASVSNLEAACSMVPKTRPDLQDLCASELLEMAGQSIVTKDGYMYFFCETTGDGFKIGDLGGTTKEAVEDIIFLN